MRPLTSDLLLRAYAMGIFPMARSRTDQRLYWIDPDQRGILPLESFHIPRSLCKTLRREVFEMRVDTAFEAVMEGCAQTTSGRPDTWINDEIVRLFVELHHLGMAHSIETWRDDKLVGGLYGLSLGAAFFGESMFSRETDASKVALVDLVARMKRAGYMLLDTQFVTDHLSRFGATEIPRHHYLKLLTGAVEMPAVFPRGPVDWTEALRQGDVRV
ncbi:MAG: leucyl/phenylalanyl-tRNA--protein transferase [Rhodospirillaceae bacterium]|nr:leucyl/phenylalanyl-tRNA--protein transferase [Rhodospirillales bacterium]